MRTLSCLVAFVVIVTASTADLDWWESSIFYQIYPRSFKDSNGDGVGDLIGITQKLDHLKDIGVGGVWLSPIYPSPMADFGYDISNYRDIDPLFGTLEDFDALLVKAKELGIRVILDLVPNHSSDEHEWFVNSLQKVDPYTDYYMWNDGRLDESGNRIPPNDWQDAFGGGSCWTWAEERQQFYYHRFHRKQPDLNYTNPLVVEEMKNVIRYWLDRGVSGFRVDAVATLFEIPADEAPAGQTASPEHLDPTYDMVQQWREVTDNKSVQYGETKVLMLEVYGTFDQVMRYYGTPERPGGHFPFNFLFISNLNKGSTALNFNDTISTYLDLMIDSRRPNWVLGNHDNHRVSARYGPELIDALNMVDLLLPGIGVTYNGEEIGMEDNTDITYEQCQDPQGINAGPDHYLEQTRDLERTPFQWDNSSQAGFTISDTPWLPVNGDYVTVNLEAEKTDQRSHYNIYKKLSALRNIPTIQLGDYKVTAISQQIFAFSRTLEGENTYIVVLNLGDNEEKVDLQSQFNLPTTIYINASCSHCTQYDGDSVSANDFLVSPKEGYVLNTDTPAQ